MAPSILLIDADTNFRRALRVALSLAGVEAGEAATLAEARAALERRHWDCVLIDLLLPYGEGRRLLAELAAQTRIGLIACCSHPEVLASVAGARPLQKPFRLEHLLEAARPWLGITPPTG